jgi:hypothetical protein
MNMKSEKEKLQNVEKKKERGKIKGIFQIKGRSKCNRGENKGKKDA